MNDSSHDPRATARRALLRAGLLIGGAIVVAVLSLKYRHTVVAGRLFGVMTGAVLLWYANAIPKALKPLGLLRCDPAVEQALRRFVGWTITLGGLAYVAAWLLAPSDYAGPLAIGALGTALLLAIGRVTWSRTRGRRV